MVRCRRRDGDRRGRFIESTLRERGGRGGGGFGSEKVRGGRGTSSGVRSGGAGSNGCGRTWHVLTSNHHS
jgi:hypothetical protein